MNGGHDLGGMHGLGCINPEPEHSEKVFHHEWEQIVFALTLASAFLRQWNLDQSRHARERQHPADYLRNSYYENWYHGLLKLLIEKELITQAELDSGKAVPAGTHLTSNVLKAADVKAAMLKGGPVDMEIKHPPLYKRGDRVHILNFNPEGHTRLPRYARGKFGTVDIHHGAHVFPDSNALGIREGQHLYGVIFTSDELWGLEAKTNFKVSIDLWEPYLETA